MAAIDLETMIEHLPENRILYKDSGYGDFFIIEKY